MNEDTYRSQFRFPYPLYEQLKAAADRNRRSVNAELVARLETTIALDEHMGARTMGDENNAHVLRYLKYLEDKENTMDALDMGNPMGLSALEDRIERTINTAFERLQSQLSKPVSKK